MRLVVRLDPHRLRRPLAFTLSASVHVSALAWVALSPLVPEKRPGLYEQEIRPHSNRIVWYNLQQRLPEISPADRAKDPRPPRARVHAPQQLAAGRQDSSRPPQLIWTPAPALDAPKVLPSPNVIALARPARPIRAFEPPVAAAPKPSQPVLPAAPELTVAAASRLDAAKRLLPPLQPARKTFIPPVQAVHDPQLVSLPAAPQLPAPAVQGTRVLSGVAMSKPIREFVPPPEKHEASSSLVPALTDAPALPSTRLPEASLAIVSLAPARTADIPQPKASQQAEFSAGPKPRPEGGTDVPREDQLSIPGLLVRSGAPTPAEKSPALIAGLMEAPTSSRNLLEAARAARIAEGSSAPADEPRALRVSATPDPRFDGRAVYSLAIQMPNVTSYSGSWLVWFAERGSTPAQTSGIRPPLPLRKVDPKYITAAADERVEGKVRLAAVIRKDGSVDEVELLEHLDARLDQSAREALAKWEFEPALRNGAPIEVDAVFDIPFHLAPRAAK
ncbi:MAG: TonB family protein [Acidobacteriia bacterium]|nr:TonB family protein [Terriglobia bacterium]